MARLGSDERTVQCQATHALVSPTKREGGHTSLMPEGGTGGGGDPMGGVGVVGPVPLQLPSSTAHAAAMPHHASMRPPSDCRMVPPWRFGRDAVRMSFTWHRDVHVALDRPPRLAGTPVLDSDGEFARAVK